jgi:hypothetical protein
MDRSKLKRTPLVFATDEEVKEIDEEIRKNPLIGTPYENLPKNIFFDENLKPSLEVMTQECYHICVYKCEDA